MIQETIQETSDYDKDLIDPGRDWGNVWRRNAVALLTRTDMDLRWLYTMRDVDAACDELLSSAEPVRVSFNAFMPAPERIAHLCVDEIGCWHANAAYREMTKQSA